MRYRFPLSQPMTSKCQISRWSRLRTRRSETLKAAAASGMDKPRKFACFCQLWCSNISGELGDMAARTINIGTVNVLNSPVYLDLRQELLRALQPFPDARRAAAAALQHLEERQRPPLLDVTP